MTPERSTRRHRSSGWIVQNYRQMDLSAGLGMAARELLPTIGEAAAASRSAAQLRRMRLEDPRKQARSSFGLAMRYHLRTLLILLAILPPLLAISWWKYSAWRAAH
jgi:hypothetical protein